MDKTLSAAAARLLDFIGGIEAPQGYGSIYGNNQDKLPQPLTSMRLEDVLNRQKGWTKRFKSSAAGRYQFMRVTLLDLSRELDLQADTIFSADFQDWLGLHLLVRRGFDDFLAGKLSRTAFGKNLAQEWASLPVLAATDGAHQRVKRGQSYYSGDALNKALVQPAAVETVLDQVLAIHSDRAGEIGQEAVRAALDPAPASPAAMAGKLAPRPPAAKAGPIRTPGIAEQKGWTMPNPWKLIGAVVFGGAIVGAGQTVDLGGVWASIVPLLAEILSGLAVAILGLIAAAIQRRTGYDVEARHREALHSAIVSGINLGLAKIGGKLEGRTIDVGSPVVAQAIDYASRSVPGALRHFKLDGRMLQDLVVAKAQQVLPMVR